MGCCPSLPREMPGSKLESSVPVQEVTTIDAIESEYVNNDMNEKDGAPLLTATSAKSDIQLSASSDSSEVDKDMIQRLLAEVEDLSE